MIKPILHLGAISGGSVCGIPGRIATGTVSALITCPACIRKARGGTYVQYLNRSRKNED